MECRSSHYTFLSLLVLVVIVLIQKHSIWTKFDDKPFCSNEGNVFIPGSNAVRKVA